MRSLRFRALRLGSIGHRIALIGIVGVAGVMMVSAAYWRLQSRVAAGAEQQAQLARLDGHRAAIAAATPQLYIREQVFLSTKDEAEIARHAQIMASIEAAAEQLDLAAAAVGQRGIQDKAAAARRSLQLYGQGFKRLAAIQIELGLNENLGQEGTLRKAVHGIETLLNQHDQPRLAVLMLMMRRHEKDFMLRQRVSYGDDIARRVATFKTLLDASAIPSADQKTILDRLSAYHASFGAYMAAAVDLTTTRAATAAAYSATEPLLEDLNGAIRSHIDGAAAAIEAELDALRQFVSGVILAACIGLIVLVTLIGRSISRPLSGLTAAIQKLGAGEFDVVLPARGRRDELGDMSVAIESFREGLAAKAREEFEREQRNEREQAAIRRQEAHRLADRFEEAAGGIVSQVADLAGQLAAASRGLTQSASSTQDATRQVSASAGEVAANAGSMARATEEMSHAIAEIDARVGQASTVASAATSQARDAEATGRELIQSTEQVFAIVGLIRTIAEQTNLLALNATIEAARAGESGRGFAVVASEVKQLAAQSAAATGTIASHVEAIRSAADRSVAGMDGIVRQVVELSDISAAISAAVTQQSAATGEISRDVQYLASAAEAVSGKILDVSDQAALTGASATQLSTSAAELRSGSMKLDEEVKNFLKAVRAA